MADPESSLFIPHIIGITLDAQGIDKTIVVATNRRTAETQRARTDSNKNVIFDASQFTSGYLVDDNIDFDNFGSSIGTATIQITNATGGF